jgi:ABC-2 type transport system ATP-binding protein
MIVVDRLTKTYGSKKAVDDLSFTVTPGRVTGFLGPNGSGKSTTMRCMLGLDKPDAGTTTFDGRKYADIESPLAHVGSLLDAGDAHKGRTARNHLRWIAMTNGISASRVDAVLQMVGMEDAARTRVGKFSLGMRQRLRWTREVMRHLADEGRSVLVSSHQLVELSLVADDLVVIGQGKLISSGPIAQFMTQHAKTWVRVVSPQFDALAELVRAQGGTVERTSDGGDFHSVSAQTVGNIAAANNIVLHELSPQTGSLEQAFLDATDASVEYRGQAATTNVWEAPKP